MQSNNQANQSVSGYKHSEVGIIPVDWEVVLMSELFTFQNGVNADKSAYGSGVPFINVLEVITYSSITENQIPGRITLSSSAINTFAVLRGDVLFNRTSETQEEVGIAAVYTGNEPVVFGGFVIRARPRNSRLISRFASYALRSSLVRSQIVARGQGVVRANIGQQELSRVQVILPPLAEQHAIAEVLGDADALIESLEQLIAKKRAVKQGVMQELLTGKTRLPGFSGEWEVKCIGDVLTIAHGKSQHAVTDRNGIYPILATGGQIGTANRFLYNKPSVLIGRKGTIDQPQYMDTPFWTVDTLFYSVIREPNNAKFLFYRFWLIDWKQHNEASGVPSLNARTIEQIELKIPQQAEQTAIAAILSDMDEEIAVLEAKLTKTRQVKQGMMHELLTGRIRLV